MPVELSKKRRYLSINEGFIKEHMGTPQELAFDTLRNVHLIHITFKVIRKDKNDPNSEVIGDVINFHLVDQEDYFVLQTWLNSIYAKCFFNLMENVDWQKQITIMTSQKIVDGKKKPALFIRQDGNVIKWKYTINNMADCPPVVVRVDEHGKNQYDNSEQEAFFLVKLDKWLMPQLEKKPFPYPNHPLIYLPNSEAATQNNQWTPVANTNTATIPPVSTDAEDDLPF